MADNRNSLSYGALEKHIEPNTASPINTAVNVLPRFIPNKPYREKIINWEELKKITKNEDVPQQPSIPMAFETTGWREYIILNDYLQPVVIGDLVTLENEAKEKLHKYNMDGFEYQVNTLTKKYGLG